MGSFLDSLYQTKKANSNQYHRFAVGLLIKANSKLTYLFSYPKYNERAVHYELYSGNAYLGVHLVNIHGDYVHSLELCQNIRTDLLLGNTLIVGDMNIPLSDIDALEKVAKMKGKCVTPSMSRSDTEDKYKTLDFVLSEIKPSYTHCEWKVKKLCSSLS